MALHPRAARSCQFLTVFPSCLWILVPVAHLPGVLPLNCTSISVSNPTETMNAQTTLGSVAFTLSSQSGRALMSKNCPAKAAPLYMKLSSRKPRIRRHQGAIGWSSTSASETAAEARRGVYLLLDACTAARKSGATSLTFSSHSAGLPRPNFAANSKRKSSIMAASCTARSFSASLAPHQMAPASAAVLAKANANIIGSHVIISSWFSAWRAASKPVGSSVGERSGCDRASNGDDRRRAASRGACDEMERAEAAEEAAAVRGQSLINQIAWNQCERALEHEPSTARLLDASCDGVRCC